MDMIYLALSAALIGLSWGLIRLLEKL